MTLLSPVGRSSSGSPSSGSSTSGSRSATPVLVAAAVVVGVYAMWPGLAGVEPGSDIATMASLSLEALCAAVAAAMLVRGAGHRRGRERRAWQLMAFGVACWSAGSLVWLAYVVAGLSPPFPGLSDVLYLALVPFVAAGVVIHPAPHQRDRAVRGIIDGLLVAASLLLVLWVSALRVAFGSGVATGGLETLVNLLYPLSDTLLIVMVLGLLLRVGTRTRRSLAFLATGLVVVAIADLVFLVLTALDRWDASPIALDSGWAVGFVFVAGAGWVMTGPEEVAARRPNDRRETALATVPTVLGGIALLAGLIDLSLGVGDQRYTLSLMLSVTGLLLLRQGLAVVQGRRLTRRLAASVERLALEAGRDRLTGLHNRSGLHDRLRRERIAALDEGTRIAAVVFVDIDHLKAVNDSLGHEVGDRLIRCAAVHLAERLGPGRATRFGGDEFVGLLAGRDEAAVLSAAADLVSEVVSEPGLPVQGALSAGVAIWEPGLDVEEVLRRADTALYRAKVLGRRRVVLHDPSLDVDVLRRIDMEPQLRRALDDGELVVHYQPMFALVSGRLVGAEALVRWEHPTRGLLPPDEFLRDADIGGMLTEIGAHVLVTATADFARLNREGPGPPLRVSVNLSTSELTSDALARGVHDALSLSGLDPADLTIEITEDVVVDEATRRTIDQLLDIGVAIAIDDFGTGNSSLRQLGSYPASFLKIDRDFVSALGRDAEATFVVRAIVNLATNLGMTTVAEGIETQEQLDILRRLGCEVGQGWYWEPAQPFTKLFGRGSPADRPAPEGPGPGSAETTEGGVRAVHHLGEDLGDARE